MSLRAGARWAQSQPGQPRLSETLRGHSESERTLVADLRQAVEAAAAELGLNHSDGDEPFTLEDSEEGTEPEGSEAPEETDEETPEGDEGAQPEVEDGADEGVAEGYSDTSEDTPAEAVEVTDEDRVAFEKFTGIDLSAIPAESHADIIAVWKDQNSQINKAQREAAEAKAQAKTEPQETEPPAEEETLSDEDIAAYIAKQQDLDPEDFFDAKLIRAQIPLVKANLELQDTVERFQSSATAEQTQKMWETALVKLEAENGISLDRVQLLEFAVENGIANPEHAFWAFVGPAKAGAVVEVNKRLAAATRESKKQATGTRPRTHTPTVDAPLKAKTTKDAIAEAARQAMDRLHVSD